VSVIPRFLVSWALNCLGILIASAAIGPIGYGHKFGTLVLAGLVLGFVNFLVRPIVILLTLPAVILSLGIFLLVINAFMLWLTSKIVSGFHVGGFWSTIGGALILWIVNMVLRPWTAQTKRRRQKLGRDDHQVRVNVWRW
jgi:putative membrane protein